MNLPIAKALLKKYHFKINVEHDTDAKKYIATIKDIWIVESGKTEQEAVKNYLQSFIGWAKDYFNEFNLNYNAPNLRPQLPLVMKALIINDVSELLKDTDVQHTRIISDFAIRTAGSNTRVEITGSTDRRMKTERIITPQYPVVKSR